MSNKIITELSRLDSIVIKSSFFFCIELMFNYVSLLIKALVNIANAINGPADTLPVKPEHPTIINVRFVGTGRDNKSQLYDWNKGIDWVWLRGVACNLSLVHNETGRLVWRDLIDSYVFEPYSIETIRRANG